MCKVARINKHSGIGIVLYNFHIFTIVFGPGKIRYTSCCRGFRCSYIVWTQWEVVVKSQLVYWICYHAPMIIAPTSRSKISYPSCSVHGEQRIVAPLKYLCSTWRSQDKAISHKQRTEMQCFNQCASKVMLSICSETGKRTSLCWFLVCCLSLALYYSLGNVAKSLVSSNIQYFLFAF